MKKYLIKIILFFIAVAVIDVLLGHVCQYMNSHSKGGSTQRRYYASKESSDDVLIFGSSRALHHYVPDIIEDSLEVSCFNVGEEGSGIIFSYGILKMITDRYSPKMIIYDVYRFDIEKDDNIKYLDRLKAYYDEPGIDSIFWEISPKSRVLMLSNMYRYNTNWLRLLGNFVHPIHGFPKGYAALHQNLNYEPDVNEVETPVVDTVKIDYFEQFIRLTQNKKISLVCCVSPSYRTSDIDGRFEPIIKLCNIYDVPFLYFGNEFDLNSNRTYYSGRTHLNDKGAHYFTSILMSKIKDFYKKQ